MRINTRKIKTLKNPEIIGITIFLLVAGGCSNTLDGDKIPPLITTAVVSNISPTTADCGGIVKSNGGEDIIAQGICWSSSHLPDLLDSKTSERDPHATTFINKMTGLKAGITYFVRAYATNRNGIGYGNLVTFTTTLVEKPVLTTNGISLITEYSAKCGGNISSDDGSAVSERGVCWSTRQNPTIADNKTSNGSGLGSFTSNLIGLNPKTTYYVRAYATNSGGTGYGNERIFSTFSGTVTDIDGNTYGTIIIGTQLWMAENLKTTKYRNGKLISKITDDVEWRLSTEGAYCNYYNQDSNAISYGHLYNWYAIRDSQNICPTGWHASGNADWTILINYLGGEYCVGKLKETGTIHWGAPNTIATNESGFTALPGGERYYGGFSGIGHEGNWWAATDSNDFNITIRSISNSDPYVSNSISNLNFGLSVRCVKD